MSYVKSSTAEDIPPETIELYAGLLGLSVSPADVMALAGAVRDQLASIGSLDQLDLTDVHPSLEFDPRWEV
jgi:hypothetical protein